MSLWQFAACVDGWNKAQGSEEVIEPLTEDEFDDMMARNADWISASMH
jgi:hypothetical protein